MDEKFEYSTYRSLLAPTYIGSYCMDALAMAFHIVYYSTSFK